MKEKKLENGKCNLENKKDIIYQEQETDGKKMNKVGNYTYAIKELSINEVANAVNEVMEFAEHNFKDL